MGALDQGSADRQRTGTQKADQRFDEAPERGKHRRHLPSEYVDRVPLWTGRDAPLSAEWVR